MNVLDMASDRVCKFFANAVAKCAERAGKHLVYTSSKHHLSGRCGWAPSITLIASQDSYNMSCYLEEDELARFGDFSLEEYPSARAACERAKEIAAYLAGRRRLSFKELATSAT